MGRISRTCATRSGCRWFPTTSAIPVSRYLRSEDTTLFRSPDWPLIAYRDSLLWYGSDKPDLRNPIRMQVVSDHFRDSGFAIFEIGRHDALPISGLAADCLSGFAAVVWVG